MASVSKSTRDNNEDEDHSGLALEEEESPKEGDGRKERSVAREDIQTVTGPVVGGGEGDAKEVEESGGAILVKKDKGTFLLWSL